MSSISVCIIAKDERENIERAIASVVDGVDEVLVVDTGSKDDTAAIAERAGARVISYEWQDDFSAARNFALDNVSSEWAFQLDADEALCGPASHLRELLRHEQIDAFLFQIINLVDPKSDNGATNHRANRLFRRREWRYRGIIHETPIFQSQHQAGIAWSGLRMRHWGYIPGLSMKKKGDRNRALLETALEADPGDFLLHYYLGDDFAQAEQWDAAGEAFERAIELCPNGASAHQGLLALRVCEALFESGEIRAARKRSLRESKRFFDFKDLLFMTARAHEASEDWMRAAKYYQRCLATPSAPDKYLYGKQGLDMVANERLQVCRRQGNL